MSLARDAVRSRPRGSATVNEILRDGLLGGLDAGVLTERFGTPLYVYDLDVVERQFAGLRDAVPPGFELAFAVKANPALAVVAFMAGLGLGADVASGGELETALRAGIAPRRIVMTGPGKRDDELAAAVRVGVGAITVESPAELARLERIAADQARIAAVLLRAALPAGSRRERLRLVGDEGAGKFGMSADDLVTAARHAVRSPHLEPLGLHAFGASNVLDPAAIADHVRATVATAADLARSVGFPLRLVDAGGGLGIPYGPGEEPLSMSGLGRALGDLAAGWAADPVTRGMRVLLEPGRYLVGPAGAYVSRVLDRKAVDGAIVAILDGGIHHLLRPALVRQAQRIELLGDREGTPTGAVTIGGPLCSGLDVLTTRAEMHAPSPGDLVAVLDAGAYGYTESMPFFLSHPIPAEVAILGGHAELIRPRIAPAEWLDRQRVPAWAPRTGASRERSADMGPVASLD